VEFKDLVQIGTIGMIIAIRKFDTSYNTVFSTYAVPMIIGEIKRFLRDDGIIKISRTAKKNAHVVDFEDEAEEEEEEKGGKGRTVLKVILAILIIVLVLEVGCMAIKLFASDSAAAEFIDTQFNKVLELIMGADADYDRDVIEAQIQDEVLKITRS
jgi:RNA polymerase sigma factor (sigma-70 family)